MAMLDDGKVLYAHRGDDWVLRVQGPLRYTNASAFNHFLDELFDQRHPASVCVDLNATTAIDSTGIGLLAKIANSLERAGQGQPIVFSDNPDINELLTSVCLDDVCRIVPGQASLGAGAEYPGEPIPPANPSERELARTITDAHRLLCDLSESNRAQFQSVVEAFEREAGVTPTRPGNGRST
jgi:anti-anti-sigma factor